MSRSAVNRGTAEMERMSPGRRRRLARSVLLLVLVLVAGALWLRDRSGPAPSAASGPSPAAARPVAAAADAERRLDERSWRLAVTTHPPGAQLSIRAAGGAAKRARTPFKGTMRGGELELTVARAGYNRLVRRVTLDRHRALDLWLDPAGLLHHKLGELRSGSNPKQVAFSPDGRELWVSLLGGRGVEVFDARTMRKRKAIRLGQYGAVEVLFTGDGRTVYASQMETASVWEIDPGQLPGPPPARHQGELEQGHGPLARRADPVRGQLGVGRHLRDRPAQGEGPAPARDRADAAGAVADRRRPTAVRCRVRGRRAPADRPGHRQGKDPAAHRRGHAAPGRRPRGPAAVR